MVANSPSFSRQNVGDRRRDNIASIIDWINDMRLLNAVSPEQDISGVNNNRLAADSNTQQSGNVQRGGALAESNMAEVPASPRVPAPAADAEDAATVIQTVYKTLDPTFTGPIAGYSTMFDEAPARTAEPDPLATPPASHSAPGSAPLSGQGRKALKQPSPVLASPSSTRPFSDTFETALGSPTGGPSAAMMTHRLEVAPSASRPLSSRPSAIASASKGKETAAASGSSAGVKTGIAFGVIGAVMAVVALAIFLFNRRRKRARAGIRLSDGDEKFHSALVAGTNRLQSPSGRRNSRAPRISLRPTGQFTPVGTSWDRRPSTSRSANAANPFSVQADRVPSTIAEESTRSNGSSPATLFEAACTPGSPFSRDAFEVNGRTLAAGTVLGAGTGLSRKTSIRKDGSDHLDLTLPKRSPWGSPPSPAETEFSTTLVPAGTAPPVTSGAAAIEAAGGPANAGVHRVELEFKPTLDDEMELCVGELVRLLHVYDDGWCLVIRLNRSRQGVVPRTCLSDRPVKPRIAPGAPRPGPPVKPSGPGRGPGAAQGPSMAIPEPLGVRPVQSPALGLPASPRPQAGSPAPRPHGNFPFRPQSPGGSILGSPQPGPPPPGPPPPGPPPPGPPPPGPPPPGASGSRLAPEQTGPSRSNWLQEPRPWAL